MKKMIFLFSLTLLNLFSYSSLVFGKDYLKKIDSNTTGTFTIKKDSDGSYKNSTYALHNYAKISLRDAEFSGVYKIPTSVFGKSAEFNNYALGASVFFKELLHIPLALKVGKLNFSGAISKLKTPVISTGVSCFSSCSSSATGISSSLPGVGSTAKPWSVATYYDYANVQGILRNAKATCFYDGKNNFGESLLFVIKPRKKIQISFSETAGLFSIENLSSSSWFSDGGFFPKKQILAANLQTAITSPYYRGRFFTNFYQLENQKLGNTFTLENSVVLPNFKLNVWGFYSNSMKIFTTSSTKLKTLWQLKINPIIHFTTPSRTALIKLGGTFYIDEKMDSLNKSTFTYKWSSGANIKKRAFSSTLTTTGTQTYYTVSEGILFHTWIQPNVLSSYTVYLNDNGKKIEKHRIKNSISAQIFSKGNFSLHAKETLELTFKEGEISGMNVLSIYAKQKIKKTNISASLNIKCAF